MDSTISKSSDDDNKKGVISKMWKRCKSLSNGIGRKGSSCDLNRKCKSLPHRLTVAPEGCFPIQVGPERERFVIKTEQVNHPLFKILLEEAEFEYGYGNNNGPLMLPCDVDHFVGVLIQIMDGCDEEKGCSFVGRTHSSYHFLTPPRAIALAT